LLLLAGLVGAAPIVVRRFPNMDNAIESIRRFSSVIGIYLLISGVIRLLKLIGGRDFNFVELAILIAMLGLGFLQGFEFVMELFRNNEELKQKTEKLRRNIIKYQETLGIIALIVSVLSLLHLI